MKQYAYFSALVALVALSAFNGCSTNAINPEEATVTISFSHQNDGMPLVLDKTIYTNAVGQDYSIKTVKYFVSHITFHNANGTDYKSSDIHFVDIRNDSTLRLELSNKILYGTYTGISFVYGLVLEDNVTSSLGIDLDRLMEWPVPMGGGYHYMKLEGDYIGSTGSAFFNFHAGPLAGIDYSVKVNLPQSKVIINESLVDLEIVMNIENWFQNPTNWDFEYWGSGIMGNPEAQTTVQANGHNVFSIQILNTRN